MSTLVTNEFFAQPGRGDDVANLLLEILGDSLQHDGCETIQMLAVSRIRVTVISRTMAQVSALAVALRRWLLPAPIRRH